MVEESKYIKTASP